MSKHFGGKLYLSIDIVVVIYKVVISHLGFVVSHLCDPATLYLRDWFKFLYKLYPVYIFDFTQKCDMYRKKQLFQLSFHPKFKMSNTR